LQSFVQTQSTDALIESEYRKVVVEHLGSERNIPDRRHTDYVINSPRSRGGDQTDRIDRGDRFRIDTVSAEVKQLIQVFQASNDEIDMMIESLK